MLSAVGFRLSAIAVHFLFVIGFVAVSFKFMFFCLMSSSIFKMSFEIFILSSVALGERY